MPQPALGAVLTSSVMPFFGLVFSIFMLDSYRHVVGSHRPSPFQSEVTLAFSDNFYNTNAVNSTRTLYLTYVRVHSMFVYAHVHALIARVLDHVTAYRCAQSWRARRIGLSMFVLHCVPVIK